MVDLVIPYEPRDWQLEAQKTLRRFSVNLLHRRAGKTVFNVIQSIGNVLACPHKNPVGAYIGPTRDQTKKTAWQYYKDFLKPFSLKNLVTFNETDLSIKFANGAYIYLLSYENPDNIRGMYMDHVVLDEYQLAPANLWGTIIRPMLIDREGKAIFSGTPAGRNQFFEVCERAKEHKNWGFFRADWNETDVIPESEKKQILAEESEEAVQQEYLLSFDAAIRGSYFGKNIARLKLDGRLQRLPHDPAYPVVTGWDMGFDGTVIWYYQQIAGEPRLIDCDIFEDEDLPYCANKVLNKPYTYQVQFLPHDGNRRAYTDKRKTVKGQLESLGLKCKVVRKLSKTDQITCGRQLLDRVIVSEKCTLIKKVGRAKISPLDSLSLYRAEYDDSRDAMHTTERHDRHSHTGNALITLALGVKDRDFDKKVDNRYNRPSQRNQQVLQSDWDVYNLR